jgi:hypothetical protein
MIDSHSLIVMRAMTWSVEQRVERLEVRKRRRRRRGRVMKRIGNDVWDEMLVMLMALGFKSLISTSDVLIHNGVGVSRRACK